MMGWGGVPGEFLEAMFPDTDFLGSHINDGILASHSLFLFFVVTSRADSDGRDPARVESLD